MSDRYFVDNSTEVFTINSSDIAKVAKRRHHAERTKSDRKRKKTNPDPFPGPAPVDPEALDRQSRGDGVKTERMKTKFWKKISERREESLTNVQQIAARTELLNQEESGYIETEPTDAEEFSNRLNQTQLRRAVDEESAAKGFDLNLPQFGPYTIDYTRNGRYLLVGGRKGHVAAIDWQAKKLKCEINVQESVHDVKWLHTENMFAVAQKRWTYIYDNQGIELHCIKKLDNILKMEFLPYHFLLACSSETGFLSWLDISIGKMVTQTNTRMGRLPLMCQNPYNAVMILGHSKGIVTMWTPNSKEPVAKMLVHRQPVTAVTVDRSGLYMATAGMDRSLKIWDLRNTYQCIGDYKLPCTQGASNLQFSDRRLLALSSDTEVHIYKDACTKSAMEFPYLTHKVWKPVKDIHFAPYEDILGIGHGSGFSSILVPGSGEPNFDALEVNPYQTKKQRQESEVKSLLEKIQPELISLNPNDLGEIDLFTLQNKISEQNSKKFVKPEKIDFEPRHKSRGRNGTAKVFHVKRTVKEEAKWRQLRDQIESNNAIDNREGKTKKEKKPKELLERL